LLSKGIPTLEVQTVAF